MADRLLAGSGASGELRRLLGTRVPELVGYRNARLAERYLGAVTAVAREEQILRPGRTQVAEAFARGYFKLLAYKDEYEVARLLLRDEPTAEIRRFFPDGATVSYNLRPPPLRAIGLQRKLRLGPCFRPALVALRSLKGLRGTALDPFGRAEVRRVERALPEQYRTMVVQAMAALASPSAPPDAYDTVVALADLPDLRRAEALKALPRDAPGPSPWRLAASGEVLPSRLGALRWRDIPRRPDLAGLVALEAPDGAILALLDQGSYLQPMACHRVLVWYEMKGSVPLHFRVLDVDRFASITGPEATPARLRAEHGRLYTAGGEVACLSVPADFPPGRHALRFPHEMFEVEELLALAVVRPEGLRLFVFRPREAAVEVVPQDRYNEGAYEAGRQRVTRVARDPRTSPVVGEGTQMLVFVLDPSMRRVAEWVR